MATGDPFYCLAHKSWTAACDHLHGSDDLRLVDRPHRGIDTDSPEYKAGYAAGVEAARKMRADGVHFTNSSEWPPSEMDAMYERLAREYEETPAVPDRGGGVEGDRFPL